MNKKALIFGGGAIAVVAIVVALIFIFTGGEDAYRSIKVFEIDGSCKVDRDGDSLDAFKNMALSSGDSLTVGDGSFARLKLDDDKYVYLEANTKINLTATGTANDSKTMVYIERGSMLTEVKKKLSATSSYDIVTPNTTMSIRGTKTLTQVLEDAVTGHVQTSNAVLEGQVKIKAVKVKADGTVVSVEKDLGAGEGNAFSSKKEELVSQEEMKSIADTGASVNGIKVEIVSEEDADVVFDVATFEASFLESVKNILIADAQAETGEEGLSQEQIDAINAQLDEVLESFDVISTESQNAINAATSGETEPEPTLEITPEPTPEATSESVWSWENIAVTETEDTQDEGTTLIEGDTNLLVIDDTNEADDTADRDNGADEVATEDDDNDDAADEDGEEADETDEDEVSDEDDDAGEDDVDDADDADDEDKSDEEGEEENTDEEDADKEDGEDEEEDDDASDEDNDEEEPLTEEVSEDQTPETPSQNDTSTSTTTEPSTTTMHTVSYSESTSWEFSDSSSSSGSDTATEWTVSLRFIDTSSELEVPVDQLPKSAGSRLPGQDAPIIVEVNVSGDCPDIYGYEFTGWYTDPGFSESSRVDTIPSSPSGDIVLYPEVRQFTKIRVEYKSLSATFSINNENTTVSLGVNAASLPTLFNPGEELPGASTVGMAEAFADAFEFVGWFTSADQAKHPDDYTPMTAVPETSSSTIDLWAGIKKKTFTVTFTNLFTRAGQVYIPTDHTNGVPGSDGITYTYDTNGGGNKIIVSGIPYGYELPLPVSLDSYVINDTTRNSIANSRLYTRGYDLYEALGLSQSTWKNDLIAPLYLGVGLSDSLSISDIVSDYYEGNNYAEDIVNTGIFKPGAGYAEYQQSDFADISKEIKDNYNLYLYFGIPVTLSVEVGEENFVKTQVSCRNGTSQSLSNLLGLNLQSSSSPVEFHDFVVLEDGSKWYFEIENEIIKATTYYYGKRLNIPRISLTEMPDQKGLSEMLYTIKLKGNPTYLSYPLFRGVTYQDYTSLLGDAVDGTDPLPDMIDGKIWYSKLKYHVALTDYAILDLSESGIDAQYINSYNVIRDTTLENQKKYKLRYDRSVQRWVITLPVTLDYTEESNAYWNNYPYLKYGQIFEKYWMPFYDVDGIPNDYNAPIYMRKNNNRLMGYKLKYTPKPSVDVLNPDPVSDFMTINGENDYFSMLLDSEGHTVLSFEGDELPVNDLVITPVFLNEQPFTTTVMRRNNRMTKSTSSQPDADYWAVYDYVTVIEGPGLIPSGADSDPFVTEIISSTLRPVYTDDGEDFTENVSLIPVLSWDSSAGAYKKLVYDSNSQTFVVDIDKSYTPINGRIEIPWSDCLNVNCPTSEYGFYKGAKFEVVEDTSNNIPDNECGVYFRSSLFGDHVIFRAKPESAQMVDGEEEWQIFSCDLPQGSNAMFTAIWNMYENYSIINEKTDSFSTPEDFLRLASGEDDLGEVWFGGKLYPMTGYSPSFQSVLITRDTVGLSGSILHGTGSFGSGELDFLPINSIHVTNKTATIVYPYNDYEFVEGSIRRKSGVVNDTCGLLSVVDSIDERYYPIEFAESMESTLPEGWIVIDYRDQDSPESYYYVYVGEDVNVSGRAVVEYWTMRDEEE